MAVVEPFAQAYAKLIRAGKRTLNQVYPADMRERVAQILDETAEE